MPETLTYAISGTGLVPTNRRIHRHRALALASLYEEKKNDEKLSKEQNRKKKKGMRASWLSRSVGSTEYAKLTCRMGIANGRGRIPKLTLYGRVA